MPGVLPGGLSGLLPTRTSPHDREIWRLALPAFGALAAEPLYVLADTAIVGQLGTRPLAGLAVAGIVLTAAYSLFNFLAYSTTAAVARQVGAGDLRRAAELGVDGMWLALGLGAVLLVLGVALAPWIVDAMGASTRVHPYAVTYLRISALGAPAYLIGLAATGYLRGLQDTRTTLIVAVAANVVNLVLEIVLVFGLDTGIAGSAWGTVIAQLGAAVAYVAIVARTVRATGASVWPRRDGVRTVAVIGGPLIVRTASLLAALLVATNLAARISDDAVAAHQIAFQINLFLALSLDAIAIAGQAMVGRFLGASDAPQARAAARRMIEWGIVIGVAFAVILVVARPALVPLFTDDVGVQHLALQVLWIVALVQPLSAVVFVLDGILIGAGDQRYLARAMLASTLLAFVPAVVVVTVLDGGLLWLWGAIAFWIAARGLTVGWRFAGTAWQVTGATR
jgi:putative MATE family efflux protein